MEIELFSNIVSLSSWPNLNPLDSVLLYGEFSWTAYVEISALWSEGIFKGIVFLLSLSSKYSWN